MSKWNHPTKTMILVQPTAQDAEGLAIPLPPDFYTRGKTWLLRSGGHATLPRGSTLYRRIYIGDILLSELKAESIGEESVIYRDELSFCSYQDGLLDCFSSGVSNCQPGTYLKPDSFPQAQSGKGEVGVSFANSPYLERTLPISLRFWVAPILSQVAVFLSYATLESIPE